MSEQEEPFSRNEFSSESFWNRLYQEYGELRDQPSQEIIKLVPRMKEEGVKEVLEVGCGAGRHTDYLAGEGFHVYGLDISDKAIALALQKPNAELVEYCRGDQAGLPYAAGSIDWIIANHSLEYSDNIPQAVEEIGRVLKSERPLLLRVVSTDHPLCGVAPDQIEGFSQIVLALQQGRPVHFFDEPELRELFRAYHIESLEPKINPPVDKKTTIPLHEWVMLAYKAST
jgi:SAM-dependent methyltransferase